MLPVKHNSSESQDIVGPPLESILQPKRAVIGTIDVMLLLLG